MKTIRTILSRIQKAAYASAPGYAGYTIYWLIVIGVVFMSAYLVGGLIPKRFPDLSKQPKVTIKEPEYNDTYDALQLRTFTAERASTESGTQSTQRNSPQDAGGCIDDGGGRPEPCDDRSSIQTP